MAVVINEGVCMAVVALINTFTFPTSLLISHSFSPPSCCR
jgi:hypothetical protein